MKDDTIAEIQRRYSGETDPAVFVDLLEQERKGKKRKVLKRWLKGEIKRHTYMRQKPPKDKITGIPNIR